MYVEEIKKKQGKKKYRSVLVRESYREKGKVKHRTIANITNLPREQINLIKRSLKGETGDFKVCELSTGCTKEYGASYTFMELSRAIGLDKIICSVKSQWREDVLAMIIGLILYQGSKLSLVNVYKDTILWSLCGHKQNERPDVEKSCYGPMDELLKRKSRIERKLAKKHLTDGCVILYDITNIWFEGAYKESQKVTYGKSKDGKKGYKQIAIGLLTTNEGCPVGVEIFQGNVSDQTTVLDEVKKLYGKHGVKKVIFTGDRGMVTGKRIEEVKKSGDFTIISALTHKEIKNLLEEEDIDAEIFKVNKITEITAKDGTRYALCKNAEEMIKERENREAMINKVIQLLNKESLVTRKRNPLRVSANIGRIFEKYRIEKFFNWKVDDRGVLMWNLREDIINTEKQLDGCYVIKTTADKNIITTEEFVSAYQSLQKIEQAFKNMKTVLLELRPVYHKIDCRIEAHIFIVMLAYYLQWHANKKLTALFKMDGQGDRKRWTFEIVIERLKSIRLVDNMINGVVIKQTVSQPDAEQKNILDHLGVELK